MSPRLLAPVLVLAVAAGCSVARQGGGPLLHGGSSPAVSAAPGSWPTLSDATFGYSLRYPPGWMEKFDQPAGFHALASRAGMTSLLDLGGEDYWLVVQAAARDPEAGCGEPSTGPADTSDTTLAGLSAKRYVVAGTRGDTTQHIIDVVAVRGGTCYTLQLVAGPAIPVDRALATLQQIQASYRFKR
jgi:hypothetical protein